MVQEELSRVQKASLSVKEMQGFLRKHGLRIERSGVRKIIEVEAALHCD